MRANIIKYYTYTCLTKDDINDVIKMRKDGCTFKQIADYIGCTPSAARYQCNKYGIPNMHKLKWSDEDDEALMKLYNDESLSLAEIAKAMNRTFNSIRTRIGLLRDKKRIIIYHNKGCNKTNES